MSKKKIQCWSLTPRWPLRLLGSRTIISFSSGIVDPELFMINNKWYLKEPSELRLKKNSDGKSKFVDTCPGQKLTSLIKICKNTDLLIEYWPNKKPECKRRTAWIMHGLNLCERRYFVKWYLHFVIITNVISKLSNIHCYDCILWSIIRVLNIDIF